MKRKTNPTNLDEVVDAIFQPLEGKTDKELTDWLIQNGATKVLPLAPGFLSVVATRKILCDAEEQKIAHVEIKKPNKLHDLLKGQAPKIPKPTDNLKRREEWFQSRHGNG